MRAFRSASVILAVAAGAAGCATTTPVPPPAATLEYVRTDCVSAPDLSTSISLTPDKERATFSVMAPVSGTTPCLAQPDGATSPYVAFALPTDFADKTVIVGTVLEALRIMSPTVVILDHNGQLTRSFSAEDYMYRGPVYSVQFRPRDTEAYVLVTADPSRVGARYDSIVVGVVTTTYYTGYGAANWSSGVEAAQSRTFSYEGTVQVTVADSDTKEEGQ